MGSFGCACVRAQVGDRVVVETPSDGRGERPAEIHYIGKVPEIAPGYWIGVVYDERVGRNNGSVSDQVYFDCAPFFGGFVRPSYAMRDLNPPPPKPAEVKQPVHEDAVKPKKMKKSRKAVTEVPELRADALTSNAPLEGDRKK